MIQPFTNRCQCISQMLTIAGSIEGKTPVDVRTGLRAWTNASLAILHYTYSHHKASIHQQTLLLTGNMKPWFVRVVLVWFPLRFIQNNVAI